MTKILLRSPKSPFEVASPEAVALQNLIGSNVGNLLFLDAAWKFLDTADQEVTPDGFGREQMGGGVKTYSMNPDEINERFDVYVIPLANAFRVSFMGSMKRLTRVVQKLKIPVVVLGGGLQASLPYRSGITRPQDEVVKAFMKAALDRSPCVGVRGEWSQDYLNQLGFKDVAVIGCPSMYFNGPELTITKRTPTLGPDAKISMSITSRIEEMGPVVMSHVAKYPNLTYIGQEMDCLRLLLWGEDLSTLPDPNPIPVHRSHPLLRENKTRFWVDPWPWIDFLRDADFVFGTRIHGNIAGLLAGAPSYVLAHDTRTAELAKYLQIPYREMKDVPPDTDAADLYAEADFGPMMAGHAARFAKFTAFVERHGLKHVFQPGEDPTAFDRRIAGIEFPPTVDLHSGSTYVRYERKVRRLGRKIQRETQRLIRPKKRKAPRTAP